MPSASPPFGDTWTFAEGTSRDVPRLIRIRENLNPAAWELALPHVLRITWTMRGTTERGLPSDDETKTLQSFENELVPRVERDARAVLVAVITEAGKRHWYFYLRDVDAFSEELHKMPQQEEPYPIELTIDRDERWALFRELIESCRGATRPPGLEPND